MSALANKNKIVAIIPARYGSTRFPGKPLALINGHPMIEWVYKGVSKTEELDAVYVATDDQRIFDCVTGFGGKVLMTSSEHQSGSDRLAECSQILKLEDDDVLLNIQGDEPLIKASIVRELIRSIEDENVAMGTLKEVFYDEDELSNPNVIKVITNMNDEAIYFSRSIIPYARNTISDMKYYRHVGLYAYRVGFLREYTQWGKSDLESIEGLEQLRVLEHGYKIKVLEVEFKSVSVDTPEQIDRVKELMLEDESGYQL